MIQSKLSYIICYWDFEIAKKVWYIWTMRSLHCTTIILAGLPGPVGLSSRRNFNAAEALADWHRVTAGELTAWLTIPSTSQGSSASGLSSSRPLWILTALRCLLFISRRPAPTTSPCVITLHVAVPVPHWETLFNLGPDHICASFRGRNENVLWGFGQDQDQQNSKLAPLQWTVWVFSSTEISAD